MHARDSLTRYTCMYVYMRLTIYTCRGGERERKRKREPERERERDRWIYRKRERERENERKRERERERERERGYILGFQYGIAPVAGFELSPLYRPVCLEVQRQTSPGYIRGALPYFRRLAWTLRPGLAALNYVMSSEIRSSKLPER
jgi:hypothetical protein